MGVGCKLSLLRLGELDQFGGLEMTGTLVGQIRKSLRSCTTEINSSIFREYVC